MSSAGLPRVMEAYRAIIFMGPSLTLNERRVAGILIAHYNQKTGQCDPSNARIAQLTGITDRKVRAATARLADIHRLFTKDRHGGKNHRCSYAPNWRLFSEINREMEKAMGFGAGAIGDAACPSDATNDGPPKPARKGPIENGEKRASERNPVLDDPARKGPTDPARKGPTDPARKGPTNSLKKLFEETQGARDPERRIANDQRRNGLRNEAWSGYVPQSQTTLSSADVARERARKRLYDATVCSPEMSSWLIENDPRNEHFDRAVEIEVATRGAGIRALEAAMRSHADGLWASR